MLQHKTLSVIAVVLLLFVTPFFLRSVKTSESRPETQEDGREKWEYLVVGAPSATNFNPSGNPRMRKLEMGGFGIEAFVLEQHMDKVGAEGWELVSVTNTARGEPVFYFKRLKPSRN
jgi:hypothetical protein